MAKILGLQPRTAAIAGGGILAAALGYFWWKNKQAASQAAASSPDGTSSTGCTDSTGASVPCPDASGIDYSGELGVIQAELESLLAAQGSGTDGNVTSGSGGPPGAVTVPKVTGKSATAAVAELKADGLKAGSEGANGGAAIVNSQTPGPGARVSAGSTVDLGLTPGGSFNGNPPPSPGGSVPGAITGLTTSNVTASGFRAAWRKPAGTTHYSYDVTYQGKRVKSGTVTASAVTVSGLTRDHTYTFHVSACSAAGCGPQAQAQAKTKA